MSNQTEGKSVVLVCNGLYEHNLRLQPWRYLSEVALGLARAGHPLTIISDGNPALPGESINGLPLVRLPNLRSLLAQGHNPLKSALAEIHPQVVLWNLGLTSLLYQDFGLYPDARQVGIFTSPIYTISDMVRLGPAKLFRNRSLTAVHLLGSLLPKAYLGKRLQRGGLSALVTQTDTTRRQILETNLWKEPIELIAPGVDDVWQQVSTEAALQSRWELGYSLDECVATYFGAPSPMRGLDTLFTAFELARQSVSRLRLLILNRRRPSLPGTADKTLDQRIQNMRSSGLIRIIEGFLEPCALALLVAATDIVTLPFELVPSDAPLSILEAQALGKPVVTTRLACLPEMVAGGSGYLAEPGDPHSLATAIKRAVANLPALLGEHPTDPEKRMVRRWQAVGAEWSHLIQTL